MIFTRAMIDLAKEIRRRAPSEIKPTIKMANPDLFIELGELFQDSKDAVMKALIKEICSLAGEKWALDQTSDATTNSENSLRASELKPLNKTMIYRGQVVQT
jgi:hypothetical protein